MAEDYAAKMTRKTDAELLQYIHYYPQYREDAVLAALDELQQRGQSVPNAEALRAELLPIVRQQAAAQETAQKVAPSDLPVAAASTEVDAAPGPALYSPVTIAVFSVLFSFVAGGVLLVINLFKLEERSKALRLLVFMGLYLVGSSWLINWVGVAHYSRAQLLSAVVNIGAVLAYLLYFWPRYVGPRPYTSRQWLPALLVCLSISLLLLYWLLPYISRLTGLHNTAL